MKNNIKSMDDLKLLDKDQVFNAYKKLKHYFFYDNTSLFVRKKLAKFESEVFGNCNELTDLEVYKTTLYNRVNDCFEKISQSENDLIESKYVGIHILPKKIKENKIKIITNNFRDEDRIEIERLNIYIDASIEVHIISTLWVMFVGRFLESSISQNSFANKMELNIDANDEIPYENFKLFKPYFAQYQSWRDDAINRLSHY